MIWITGSRGMLGTELALLLEKNGAAFTGTDRELDIRDRTALLRHASSFAAGTSAGISWIINCAAYTAVDRAEDDIESCRALNVHAAENLAAAASEQGARFLHISTDYVFAGNSVPRPPRPWREDDAANPSGVYSATKRDGEIAALQNCKNTWIIRSAWLYGEYGNNFVHTMLRLMNGRDSVSVVNDQRGSPTWAGDLAEAIVSLTGAVDSGRDVPPGIYHYSGEGDITWHDFAREIYAQGKKRGLVTKDCAVNPCTTAEYPARAVRPAYSVLDKTKIKNALGISVPAWDESLARFLDAKKAGKKDAP